ncbi:hypothetical protein [Clostridium sp. DL1XJH146]
MKQKHNKKAIDDNKKNNPKKANPITLEVDTNMKKKPKGMPEI